jgi:integrase
MAKKAAKRIAFTTKRLESLQAPATGREYIYDAKVPGLAVCLTAGGEKTFYLYKWTNNKPVRVRLGTVQEMSVQDARDQASDLLSQAAKGVDIQGAKRAKREEPTFADLWTHWEAHSQGRKKARSIAEDNRQYTAYLKDWANRRLSSIKRQDVSALHSRLGTNNGAYQANRVLSLVKAMFNKADALGWKGENPARKVEKFPETSRDRFLMPEELPAFFNALTEEKNPFIQGFFMLALLTGARRRNLEAMRWAEISWELKQWRIPDTKGGFAVVVPLCAPAIQVLEQLRHQEKASEEWVFPSDHGAAHLKDPMPAWRRLCKRAGFVDADNKPTLHIHDLRRSLGSWQAITGASLQVIGKTLGHVRPETTAIYARLTNDTVRDSVDLATSAMLALKGKPNEPATDATVVNAELAAR